MLTRLIEVCLENRFLVIVLVALVAVSGVYNALVIPMFLALPVME